MTIRNHRRSVLKIGRNAAADVDLRLDSCILPSVTHCRDLGVTITSDLSFTQYITEIVSKAHRRAIASYDLLHL